MYPKNSINIAEIEALQPDAKAYKHYLGGGGLHIFVTPQGSKCWRLKYRFQGKEKNLALGVFPEVSIEEALSIRDAAKRQIRYGINPSEAKKELRKKAKHSDSKTLFRIDLAENGALIIECGEQSLSMTAHQTNALRSFLNINPLTTP